MTTIGLQRVARKQTAGLVARVRALRAPGTMTTDAAALVGVVAVLLGIGLIMILSSSWVSAYQRYGSAFHFFQKQLIWAVAGVFAMVAAVFVDYRRWRTLGYVLLVVSSVGLVLVLHPAIGTTAGGSSRWIGFGSLRVQPSEIAKLGLLLVCADLCVRREGRLRTLKQVVAPVVLIGAAIGALVMGQPDMGTTMILVGIVFMTLYLAGAGLGPLAGLGAVGAVGALGLALSAGYRRERFFSFFNPFADPLNTGYHAVQSQIALGSGGLFGVGLGASRQKWTYVPNAHTDFIFSIIGEEAGLVGTFAVMVLFAVFAVVGVRIARRAPDRFGQIVAGVITAWIIGQALINMGAVTGLLPITGVPLPLVSFGGSSLVFTLVALGILCNIARQEVRPKTRNRVAPSAQG